MAVTLWRATPVRGASSVKSPYYNREAATRYLDQRETWWQQWPRAQKDHGTVCVSCHTQLPYAMVRPALGRDLGETQLPAPEKAMLDSVELRVKQWSDVEPFYSDAKNGVGKTVEARDAEAVLNAIILASLDTHSGQRLGHLRPVTESAFANAWALQEPTGPLAGSWKWQNFHLGPWEGDESGYQLSALLLTEADQAPGGYAQRTNVQPHLASLREYLHREYGSQPLVNKLYVLWASASEPSLLSAGEKRSLLASLRQQQQPDGGWNTFALDPYEREDNSPAPTASDAYATGLAVLALEDAALANHDPMLRRGIAWLESHQNSDGTWSAESINKHRDAASAPALFMTDAATAYAVLALDQSKP